MTHIIRSRRISTRIGFSLATILLSALSGCTENGRHDGPPTVEEESIEITLDGVHYDRSNSLEGEFLFHMSRGAFPSEANDVTILVNGQPLPSAGVVVDGPSLSVPYRFQDGKNEVLLIATDSQGSQIYFEGEYWAGENILDVMVLDENGAIVDDATVTATLVDDARIALEQTTNEGEVLFDDLPTRTFILTARSDNGGFGTAGAVPGPEPVTIPLTPYYTPSTIDNNDFHYGNLKGWNIGTSPVELVEHADGDDFAPSGSDWDMELSTLGEGPQSVTRTFVVLPGTKSVTIRFRFVTSEVPGGYFGSQFNDYYSVVVRSEFAGGFEQDNNSMNGLGLGAFDSSGRTAWREVSLPIDQEGDIVQADVTVANVEDGLYDSQVIVDLIEETTFAIRSFALHDIDGSTLNFLSGDSHSYFGGNTRIHGAILVEGSRDDSLESLTLEVLQNGSAVATGSLASARSSELLVPFGDDGRIELSSPVLLFELSSSQASLLETSVDGTVRLRVRARSSAGAQSSIELPRAIALLARYDGARYGNAGRDADQGGDDWVLPSVRDVVAGFVVSVNDISNMNGGSFPPHSSHHTGRDVDFIFSGYANRNATTPATILEQLNTPGIGSRIQFVFVTYSRSDSDAFWMAIKEVTLADGRKARDVIQSVGGHEDHAHWRIAASH